MVASKSKAQAGNVLLLAEEINYLIYAYFLESGFEHSAYNLRSEARLDISSDTKQLIHRGRLVEYLAKALLYVEVETHFDRPSSTTCNAGFTLLGKHHCSSSSASKRLAVAIRADDPPPHAPAPVSVAHAVRESITKRKLSAVVGAPDEGTITKRMKSRHSAKGVNSEDAPMHEVVHPPLEPPRAPPESARSLVPRPNLTNGRYADQLPISGHWSISPVGAHAADIRACSWNPHFGGLLATASTDGSINIWDTTREGDAPSQYQHPDSGDIVGVEWSSNGRWLASASVTGTLAVWEYDRSTLCEAAGTLECSSPIRSLRFSPSGDFIALAHLDGKVTVWNVKLRSSEHIFDLHSLPCLDVDWRDDRLLASCSDMQIAITTLDSPRDVLSWKAHDDEINQIRFSRDRRLLASCSDDGSAKVWRIIQSTTEDRVLDAASKMQLVTILSGHNSRVTRLEWSPALPEDSLYIITCAIDSSARVWDVMSGQCLQHVGVHQTGCYAAAFSPNGRLFATAGGDGSLYVAPFERWKHSERLVAWTDDQGQPVHDVAFNLVDGRQSLAVIAGRRVLLVRIA